VETKTINLLILILVFTAWRYWGKFFFFFNFSSLVIVQNRRCYRGARADLAIGRESQTGGVMHARAHQSGKERL
jgi:hypothetical protein